MKAILIVDMPSSCGKCKLADFGRCWGTRSYVHMKTDGIPVDCPLKPMDDYILCKKKQEVVERFPNGKMIVKEVYEPIGEEDVGTM